MIQKSYGAASARALKIGVGLNAVGLLLFAFVPVLLGMAGRVALPPQASPDLVLPAVLQQLLPTWLGALALAAVFSTEVDTSDAILFMISTSMSKDIFKRYLKPEASDAELLRVARISAVVGGTLGVLLSIYLSAIVQAMTVFYSLLGRQPVRAGAGRPVFAPGRVGRGARRHRRRRRHAARGTLRGCRPLPLARPDADRARSRRPGVFRHSCRT